MANVCTQSSSRRLSDRSATRPANAPMNSTGPNCAAAEQPEGEAAVRQLQHQERLRDQRQPVARPAR